MAWVIVDEATNSANSARNIATGAFTPSTDALAVFGYAGQEGNTGDALATPPFTLTGGTELTPALIDDVGPSEGHGWGSTTAGSGDYILGGGTYQDQADATPVSENHTFEIGAQFYYYALGVLSVTGHDTASPIVQSAWNADGYSGGSNGPHNLAATLGSAPTAGNLLLCFVTAGADSGGGFSLPYAGASNSYSNAGALAQATYVQSRWFSREVVSGDSATTQCDDVGNDVGTAVIYVIEVAAEGGAAAASSPPETRSSKIGHLLRR